MDSNSIELPSQTFTAADSGFTSNVFYVNDTRSWQGQNVTVTCIAKDPSGVTGNKIETSIQVFGIY